MVEGVTRKRKRGLAAAAYMVLGARIRRRKMRRRGRRRQWRSGIGRCGGGS
ncbi:unnamed protein product, partial [Linum tenue]